MNFGYFDDEKYEYVITNPKTPTKWINYVGTLVFGGFIDHTGGSLICRNDPALNRITKYIQDLPASEFKGETLYLRIKKDNGFQIFSPYYVPTLDPFDLFRCHVGLGYTRIVSEFHGIHTEVTIFVPVGDTRLIRDIRVTNLTRQPVEVDAIPVVEYTHPRALLQFTNADWVPQTMQSQIHGFDGGQKILTQFPFMTKETQINYFTSNKPVSSFESDRRHFLGENEYGTWARPISLEESELSDYEAVRGNNIGALLHHLGAIDPGETVRFITQLGQGKSVEEALPCIRRFWKEEACDRALKEVAEYWETYLSRLKVETPDSSLNSMLNVHNPRQCHTTKNWSRYLSLYQLGLGARGIGFRDSSQDVLGILTHAPEEGKELISQLFHVQKRDGSAMHQYNPMTMIANEGDSREVEDGARFYSDDHLWIILATIGYLKESGDLPFLDEVIPYYEKDANELPIESGTVRDHLRRGVEFTHRTVGSHGLPLLGYADWNDTVNLRKGAESAFTANLYGKALRELIDLTLYLDDAETMDIYHRYYEEMKDRLNEVAWDGEWYVRYFDVDGQPLGSGNNAAGQIFANGQSWPVISGFAPPPRAKQSLDSIFIRLNTENGIKLSAPGYNGYDANIGGVSTYPPGTKENGGIFLHANPWVIIAETLVGNGDRAFDYYRQINPAARNETADQYESEPYVYPQNILGDEHPLSGLARNSWLSGTASWMYQAGTQYILGIRPTFKGLQIDPCIPSNWDGYKATRMFRGTDYEILVNNPNHISKGIRSMRVDGIVMPGNIIPIFKDGNKHRVEVEMGAP